MRKTKHQIGAIISSGTKDRLLKAMKKSGRTLSAEAEQAVLKGLRISTKRGLAKELQRDLYKAKD
jgi:hypothetical protein